MRYSTIFTTLFLALTSALGLPNDIRVEADQVSVSHVSNGFHWVNATSKNGKPFRIGYPKTNPDHFLTERSELARGVASSDLETRDYQWYSVVWPVASDGSWKEVTNVPQLTKYDLFEQSQPRIYKYALDVYLTNTGWGTTYTFEDQEGDEYPLTAFTNGKHNVDYDSDAPNIKRVKTDQEF
ncbi:hypothetical protein B0H13DRAFT_2460905 [Mycena leptocephala]|nr:hypothetical protein B0H13DRAFT_2460905 [Mycena leptocephala]